MVEDPNKSQPNPGLRPIGTPFSFGAPHGEGHGNRSFIPLHLDKGDSWICCISWHFVLQPKCSARHETDEFRGTRTNALSRISDSDNFLLLLQSK